MEVDWIARGMAAGLLVGLPILAVPGRGSEQALRDLEDRSALYVSATLSLLFIGGLTLAAAVWRELPARELGWRVGPAFEATAWAVGVTVVGLGVIRVVTAAGRRLGLGENPWLARLMPRSSRERLFFLVLSLAAGLCEEYVYRGFALRVLGIWTGEPAAAVAITSLSFGLAHGYQRTIGVVRATLLGVVLAVAVRATGSLYPSVVGHFWINAWIGLGGWRRIVPEKESGG